MNKFKKLFLEALRIKKKALDNPDKRQEILKDIHGKEIKKAIKDMDPLLVGYINDIKVIKSFHSTEVRDGDTFGRSASITNDFFLTTIKKLFLKPLFKPRQKTAVVYKNPKGKYDLMIVELRGKVFTIITIIKKNERVPYDAKPAKRASQSNIIVENIVIDNIIIV